MNTMPSLKELPLVILCGGKSSRMGEDKSLLPFSSYSTLIEYQYQRLAPHFNKLYLSSKVNKFEFLKNTESIIYDTNTVYSPMIALHSILHKIQDEKVFVLTVDTPFVTLQTIQKLFESSLSYDITVAKTQRLHNLCGVFKISLLPIIEQLIKRDIHKIGYLLKESKTQEVRFPNENEFLNLNNQEEYKKALSLIS